MDAPKEAYSWKDYSATILGRTLVGIQEINDDSEVEVKTHYGKGDKPVSYGQGNWKGSGKMTLSMEEYEKIVIVAAPYGGNIEFLPPFPVVGLLETTDGRKFREVYPLIKFKKVGNKKKQGDTEFTIDIDFEMLTPAVRVPI